MEKIKVGDKSFHLFIKNADIMAAVDGVAGRINADFRDSAEPPVLLVVTNGAMVFAAHLFPRLDFDFEVMSIKLSSYSGTSSTGSVKTTLPLSGDVKGRRVIVVEDIVDTGTTIEKIREILDEGGAADVKICTLMFKPSVYGKTYSYPLKPLEYVAMEVENRFVVGFGLDYNELGRKYPDIYELD